MKKTTLALLVSTASLFVACPGTPQNFIANFVGVAEGATATFASVQGGSDGRDLNVCGTGGFTSGTVTVSLEGAPVGVSITTPTNKQFTVVSCAATGARPSIVIAPKNFILSVANNATIGNNQAFKVVVQSSNVTQKLNANISITAPQLLGAK